MCVMNKFEFVAYLICAVLMFSSFDLQKCIDALQKAYEDKDYKAYVNAFPDKYEDFVNVYGYDSKNRQKKVLYDVYVEHLSFLFDNDLVLDDSVLDKLLNLSYNYIWDADAVEYVIMRTKQLLLEHPQRMTEYFSEKTDGEVTSFLQMALTCLIPEDQGYLSKYHKLVERYTPYSNRIVQCLKIALKRAKKASDVLVVY